MYLRHILTLLSIFFLFACTYNNDSSASISVLKKLEYSRESDSEKWNSIYLNASPAYKNEILISISKTKNDSLIPWLTKVLNHETEVSLQTSAVFALGQTGSEKAENVLHRHYKSSTSNKIKKQIIKSLAQCGTKSSVSMLNEALLDSSLLKMALQTSAILSRKKIDVGIIKQSVTDSSWTHSQLKESAYFIYYSAEKNDLELIVNNLSSTKGLAQKYYLKALNKILNEKGVIKQLSSDSLLTAEIGSALKNVLNGESVWQNKYHALKCFAFVADSSHHALLKSFTSSKNSNLRLEGFKAYSSAFPKKSITFLLNTINTENNYSIKGKLIGLVAGQSSNTGFRLIQKNLDKGTISFKEDLLRALEHYNNNFARNTLSGFLMVQEKRLVNLAFSILRKKKQITLGQIRSLMNTDHFSVLFNLLDWQKENKRYVETNLLIAAFKKFNGLDQFEAQELVLELLQAKNEKLDATQLEELSFNLSTKKISEKFQTLFPNYKISKQLWNSSQPDFLAPDSAVSILNENILVEITTNKGEIKLELYPKVAPQTVKNFLELSKMGFYNNLIFHRVIADFVIQGGDPTGDGWGGAGYTIASEDYLAFERGTIGIATSGFDTGSCQFFICQSEQPHLRGNYTAFGKVTSGLDVVDNIQIDDVIHSIKRISQK